MSQYLEIRKESNMNKVVKILFASIFIFCFLTVGCNSDNNAIIVTGDMIKYNRVGPRSFGFNLNLIDNKPNSSIEFVNFSGKNTEGLNVEYIDDTFKEIKNKKIEGRYLTILGFKCLTAYENVEIDSLTLNINNKKTVVKFSTPLIHTVKKEITDDSVNGGAYASMICTSSFSNTDYYFEYHAEKNAELISFGFNDFVFPKDSDVTVNNISVGSIDDAFPLSVKSGDSIMIQCKIDFKPNSENSEYTNVAFNSELTYHAENLSENSVLSSEIYSQGISNLDDAKALISELK